MESLQKKPRLNVGIAGLPGWLVIFLTFRQFEMRHTRLDMENVLKMSHQVPTFIIFLLFCFIQCFNTDPETFFLAKFVDTKIEEKIPRPILTPI